MDRVHPVPVARGGYAIGDQLPGGLALDKFEQDALLALRPEGAEAYGSPEGVMLILAGAGVSLVAHRIMLRIGRLPEPQRWFA